MDSSNPELKLAGEFLRDTSCNIFLTGKAGTGKTTFLHNLRKESDKRMIVTAPTGVAAINAGGVTLHSFFQLPFGPFLPGSEANAKYRYNKEKINIIKSLDLLVIDEISMVRADLLDGVDSVLRRYRRSNLPFGGVQLLMIGDLHQLPPVVKEEEWGMLRNYYTSPYFFSCNALQKSELLTIELLKIYRQADADFIQLLNNVRENKLDDSTIEALNSRYIPDPSPQEHDGYITLCTHNSRADAINAERLNSLSRKAQTFIAEIEGEFPEHTFPTAESLTLKEGAQVMFMRNDNSSEKRFFNGKIGTITHISGKDIRVKCSEDSSEIKVAPLTWENIQYNLNQETMEISENRIGAFIQYPLKLAWAITIHKSQGLTFDKVIIDAQAAFAHGQVYVALSRCRTLTGMVLSTKISTRGVKTDRAVLDFDKKVRLDIPPATRLTAAKIKYQQRLLLECFDFQRLQSLLDRFSSIIKGNRDLIRLSGIDDLQHLQKTTFDEIYKVGRNFKNQLQSLFRPDILPSDDEIIVERITKASAYFQEKTAKGLHRHLIEITIDTDNKEIRKKAKATLKLLCEENEVKMAAVQSCENGFSPSQYLRNISRAEIEAGQKKIPARTISYSEADIEHPELFQTLQEWRDHKAKSEDIPHYMVLHQKTLVQITINLPDSPASLKKIKGIGKKIAGKYGEELIDLVTAYREKYNITQVTLPTPKQVAATDRKKTKPDTKKISFELFKKGLTIPEIAEKRELVPATIEGHLAYFVGEGKISIDHLLPAEKIKTIEKMLSEKPGKLLSEIKLALGDGYSYGEIKLVQAHLNRNDTAKP